LENTDEVFTQGVSSSPQHPDEPGTTQPKDDEGSFHWGKAVGM